VHSDSNQVFDLLLFSSDIGRRVTLQGLLEPGELAPREAAAKPPMVQDDRQTRLREFRQHFGDLDELEQDFLRQMSRVD
jgi:hypothetical protein